MTCDYKLIRAANQSRYGTDIGRYGPMLLAERYADRTHFIYELLQNAEDALARRTGWHGSRSVTFHLNDNRLQVSHFGRPFDEADVRGICGIGETTKDQSAIGRFGIGFKSVYAFADRPEIHSGSEDFAIENFVWPVAAPALQRHPDETVILMPLKPSDSAAHSEIAAGFGRPGPATLLFLREIEEIQWRVRAGPAGQYLRESKTLDTGVRRVTLIGQQEAQPETDETWLVFSRPVTPDESDYTRYVEIAFPITHPNGSTPPTIERVQRSPLVVFFPTDLETHLGFLVQGPYRATPSRDNVYRNDSWNRRLVTETASLLLEALDWLRDHDLLDAATLRCVPLDSTKFDEANMFAPMFSATKEALLSRPLLPAFTRGHVPGASALLARSEELRSLFSPTQLALLLREHNRHWLSPDITQVRAPDLYQYLTNELSVAEIRPETIVPRLDKGFLEAQSDQWIQDLYEFLNNQPALRRRLDDLPLIRLQDGTHVPPRVNGQLQAFLPSPLTTGFPTVRSSVCSTESAHELLTSLGLTEPDPVDDAIRNLLPKYQNPKLHVDDAEYEGDIQRILAAFGTDSKQRRDKLIDALKETTFLVAVDAQTGARQLSKPSDVYIATQRLKDLFEGVGGVLLVDDSRSALRGEAVRDLLEACGATRYLQPIKAATEFSWDERREMRTRGGCTDCTNEYPTEDFTLRGLDKLFDALPTMTPQSQANRASLLWEELRNLEDRRGTGAFSGTYRWQYYYVRTYAFDAAFVRLLNRTPWVPGRDGRLIATSAALFEETGWTEDPFLLSKIKFKPPVLEALAKEAGIDLGVLDLLKKLGVTSEAQLKERLGLKEEPSPNGDQAPNSVKDALNDLFGEEAPQPTPAVPDPAAAQPSTPGQGSSGASSTGSAEHGKPGPSGPSGAAGTAVGAAPQVGTGSEESQSHTASNGTGAPSPSFISYVATHPNQEEPDPDGLDQAARMALEESAINFILKIEPGLQRTPTHNPGFDLFEPRSDGQPIRWVEVKAMTGSLTDRPVGLSHTQFKCAQTHGDAYWLYVVEHAGDEHPCLVRISDPAGKARTFTFDHGWLEVAGVVTGPPASEEQHADGKDRDHQD